MNSKESYLILGDLKLEHLLFLLFSNNSSLVIVCAYRPNRVFKIGIFLSRFFRYSLRFSHNIFDDIFFEGECLYQYSSRLTIDICEKCYKWILTQKDTKLISFWEYIVLKYFRSNYSHHVSVVRQVLAFSVLSKSIYPNHKLLLQCDDNFLLQNFNLYQKYTQDIAICNFYSSFIKLLSSHALRAALIFLAYFITCFYESSSSLSKKFSELYELVILKSSDSPFADKSSRSISTYTFLSNLSPSKCFYFKSGNLFSLVTNEVSRNSPIKIISLKSLFASNNFLGRYLYFAHQLLQLPVCLITKIRFLNCLTFDFFNAALLFSFLSFNLKITHAFTDNNIFTDAIILYKLTIGADNIDIVQLQYSCLACPNPIMLSAADSIALFDRRFKSSFAYNSLGPKNFIDSDYIFNLHGTSAFTKSQTTPICTPFVSPFNPSSYDLVIGYLDESIQQNDCWPAISFAKAYNDFKLLCEFILRYDNIALVCKPQFKLNAPSNIFSSMQPLSQLIIDRRYYELGDNSLAIHQRNNLLPSVAFNDVDICIGSAFGGTASYECALTYKRSVLIDVNHVKSPLLTIPSGDQVAFSSIIEFLELLSQFPDRSLLSQTAIGVW